jgi:hypothetical protein
MALQPHPYADMLPIISQVHVTKTPSNATAAHQQANDCDAMNECTTLTPRQVFAYV